MSDEGPSAIVVRGPAGLKMALIDIGLVRHHEEVVPALLEELTREIERDRLLKHPIIVDEATFVILDGTHRVEALKALGCRRVAACLVDYMDPRIRLGCWYRTLRGLSSLPAIAEHLGRELGLRLKICRGLRPEDVGRPPVAVALTDGRLYIKVMANFESRREAWELVKKLERALRSRGLEVGFEVEEDAMSKLANGEADAVLMTPRVLKSDVIETALSGHVFPHKTTRHEIPDRPLFLNVPLELLKADRPLEELRAEFSRLVSSKKARKLPPGSVINGRRYKESIFILE